MAAYTPTTHLDSNAKTGIEGLDDVLAGGLSAGHVFLLEGEPGAGKITAATAIPDGGGLRGCSMRAPVDITYLADSVLLLRYFEAHGRVRRALSVIKKRTGAHESTIREYRLGNRGLLIGKPLEEFQGALRGVPNYAGSGAPLLSEDDL